MIKNPIKLNNPFVFKIAKVLVFLLAVYAAVTLLIRFVVPVVLNTFWGKDIASIDDSSLQLLVVNLPPAENSFYDLVKIKNVINIINIPVGKRLAIDFLSSDSWENEKVEDLLNDNKAALRYFDDAASKQKFQSPETDGTNKVPQETTELNPWRQAAQLSCIRSIWLAKNGRGEEAVKAAMNVMAVGDAIEKSQTNLITYLVGVALKKDAIDTLQKVLSISNIDQQKKIEYKNKLITYNLSNNSSVWKSEYLNHKRTILAVVSEADNSSAAASYENVTVKPNYYFKPNLSIKEDFNYFTNLINKAKDPCNLDAKDLTENEFKLTPYFKLYFAENALSKILLGTADAAYKGLLNNKCKVQQKYLKLLSEFWYIINYMTTYNWYSQLIKPSWSPPSWVFGPVWTFLYILIAISFGKVFIMIWQKQIPFIVALPFILNIIFNLSFTPIQFGLKNNLFASLDIILILITLVWAIVAIYPYSSWLAYIQIPYLIWVSIATVLQLTITYLNK